MDNYQGTGKSQDAFFQEQEKIPVEISPPDPTLEPLQNFQTVSGIHPSLAKNIQQAGYTQPTPVQKWGIPLLLRGGDVMACAQTGSGKTAFYLLPPINNLLQGGGWRNEQVASPKILVLGPTRELCVQISEEAIKFTQKSQVKAAVVYGGTDYKESFRQLKGGVDILVATPGRLKDLCDRNNISLKSVQSLILDEADRMLDMGFEPQIRQIIMKLGMPKDRQTVMTSATFPAEVQMMARDFMRTYSFLAVGRVGGTVSSLTQKLAWVEDTDKDNYLFGIMMHQQQLGLMIVFVNTKQQAVDLDRFLSQAGFSVTSIHGDRTQQEREYALESFKSGETPVMIATDVAARGLDIPNVDLVVQYDLAMSVEDYVHRIGRTARIGRKGISIGMVNNRQKGIAAELAERLHNSSAQIPPWLIGMAVSTGNYDPNAASGDSPYGGWDIRKSQKKGFQSPEERDAARRFAGFSKNAYGEGDESKAAEVAASIGPQNQGSYSGAVNKKGDKGKGKGKGKRKGKEDDQQQFQNSYAGNFTGQDAAYMQPQMAAYQGWPMQGDAQSGYPGAVPWGGGMTYPGLQ